MYQRLDISLNDNRCLVCHNSGIWVPGMMRRLSNSLFMERRACQRRSAQVTTTDLQTALSEENHRPALRLIFNKQPTLKGRACIGAGERREFLCNSDLPLLRSLL